LFTFYKALYKIICGKIATICESLYSLKDLLKNYSGFAALKIKTTLRGVGDNKYDDSFY